MRMPMGRIRAKLVRFNQYQLRLILVCLFTLFGFINLSVLVAPLGEEEKHQRLMRARETDELIEKKAKSTAGVYALARRRVPEDDFLRLRFKLVQRQEEFFSYGHDSDNNIEIRASTISSLAHALDKFYVKECNTKLSSWASRKADMGPGCIAALKAPIVHKEVSARVRYRYYMNQVTWSYSYAWWGWSRWEEELDWMSLAGVNLALAHCGQEEIWFQVWSEILSPQPFRSSEFFTGIAYLAWHRMGNVQSIGYPLRREWMKGQLQLQKKILKRMTELGIQPILPAFNLHIPRQMLENFPRIKFEKASFWSGFFNEKHSGLYRLSAGDPWAERISKLFIEKQLKIYGPGRYFYSVDLFNEMSPNTVDVGQTFRAAAKPVIDADPHAVLVVQMWCFAHDSMAWTPDRVTQFMRSVSPDRVIYLDLHGDKRPQWKRLERVLTRSDQLVWTLLHNFGGTKGMAGALKHIRHQIELALHSKNGIRGLGISMEGIEQNEILYQFVLDQAWDDFENDQWLQQWINARYQVQGNIFFPAWECALSTVYNRPFHLDGWGNTKSIIEERPARDMARDKFQPTVFEYNAQEFRRCVQMFVSAMHQTETGELQSILYDGVDFVRQTISDEAFSNKENIQLLIEDVADILETHWMWKTTMDDVDWDSLNDDEIRDFRLLFTYWSKHTEYLHSYSSRFSADIVKQVYLPRWASWLKGIRHKDSNIEDAWIASEVIKYPAKPNINFTGFLKLADSFFIKVNNRD
mmetsp:Transcript_44971/g.71844  ORF Transcript_44971/g.71844 Transcript_44971/m.71844 type:complete len:750 (-) Transcript_44971:146-2395(-)